MIEFRSHRKLIVRGVESPHPVPLATRLCAFIRQEIATLDPGCFAMVMATGIVSNAFFLQGPRGLSDALFLVNIFAYISLNLCTLVRIFLFPRKVWADLVDPQRVFSFFTIIAGSDVLGMGLDLRDFGAGPPCFGHSRYFCG